MTRPAQQLNIVDFKRMANIGWPLSAYRGSAATYDFDLSANDDGQWHDLDLKTIVPFGYSMIMLRFIGTATAADNNWCFIRKGDSHSPQYNAAWIYAPSTSTFSNDIFCFCDKDRMMEYSGTNNGWTNTYITVGAYWP